MAWTNLTFAFGSVLTSAKMTQLYDNLTAMANNDSGSPTFKGRLLKVGLATGSDGSAAGSAHPTVIVAGATVNLQAGQQLLIHSSVRVDIASGKWSSLAIELKHGSTSLETYTADVSEPGSEVEEAADYVLIAWWHRSTTVVNDYLQLVMTGQSDGGSGITTYWYKPQIAYILHEGTP